MTTITYVAFVTANTLVGCTSKEQYDQNPAFWDMDVDKKFTFEWTSDVTSPEAFEAWKAETKRIAKEKGYNVYY